MHTCAKNEFSLRVHLRLHNFSSRSAIRNENSAKCCKKFISHPYRHLIFKRNEVLHTFSYLYLLSLLSFSMRQIIARTLKPSFFYSTKKFLCKWNRFECIFKFDASSKGFSRVQSLLLKAFLPTPTIS